MIRSVLIASILLSGCASYSEIQDKTPTLELSSAKAPDVFAGCIAPKFMEIWPGMVFVIPDGVSTVVAVAGASTGFMAATLTISPTSTGSHVSLREMSHINLGNTYKRGRDAAQACK